MTTDTDTQVEIPAPDATVTPEVENVADPSPAVVETDESEAPKAKGVQKRLDELTRNWREAERREAALLAMLQQRDQPRQETAKPTADEAPKTLADFEYDEGKFQAYIFEQAEKRSTEAARRELTAERERTEAQRREASFRTRVTEFAKTVEDYDAVVTNPRLPITAEMAQVIKESEDGPALAYHLGKNPDIAEKIAQLPPIVAARELGKIEARLAFEKEKAKEAKSTVSKAPPPPPKVEAVESAVNIRPDDPESDKLPMSEWLAKREKQIARKKA